jgi:hypothetical protein
MTHSTWSGSWLGTSRPRSRRERWRGCSPSIVTSLTRSSAVLAEYQPHAELVRLDDIDERLSDLDDWELLVALYHHTDPWDGLITTDSGMLNQGPELAALIQTKLTGRGDGLWGQPRQGFRALVRLPRRYL